jgi:hypothetical protein
MKCAGGGYPCVADAALIHIIAHVAEVVGIPSPQKRPPHRRSAQCPALSCETNPSRAFYSFFKYATSAARSSGVGARSKCTPSVVVKGGTTPGNALAIANLNNSM